MEKFGVRRARGEEAGARPRRRARGRPLGLERRVEGHRVGGHMGRRKDTRMGGMGCMGRAEVEELQR